MTEKPKVSALLGAPTLRVAATYLGIIMFMSITFSVIFYQTSKQQFSRPVDPPRQIRSIDPDVFRDAVEERFTEAHTALVIKLIWINVGTLLLGSVISYLLARQSLRPIEESMEAQAQFISDASHELRTPLTVLQTTNEVALRKKTLAEHEARDLLQHNVVEVKKLRDLSNTLLDLLKNEHALELRPVSVQQAVSEALGQIVTMAQTKEITIQDASENISAASDPKVLVRIICILLDNAVKYSHKRTTIYISTEKTSKQVRLHIRDEGVGIPEADLPHVFRRFYRADKSRGAQSAKSYGLGLAIAEKLAAQINARLSVKSTVGEGSTFTVALPVKSV